VLVVIGANREKTQQESSKRSKLDNENEHEDETDRGNNSGAQTSEMLPCWDADLVENPVGQSSNKIIHRGGLARSRSLRAGTKISFRLSPPPYRSRPRARARYRFLTALAAIGCLDQKP
jgi:hypothetical protein